MRDFSVHKFLASHGRHSQVVPVKATSKWTLVSTCGKACDLNKCCVLDEARALPVKKKAPTVELVYRVGFSSPCRDQHYKLSSQSQQPDQREPELLKRFCNCLRSLQQPLFQDL